MSIDPLTSPAQADSPDPDRAGPDASASMPEWLVHLFALVIRFILEHSAAARARRGIPAWLTYRDDLPPGSTQQLAASIRGEFGTAIEWMCLRRGYGPGHKDWPYLSRMIVMFGGSLRRFRPGAPAYGLQWFENPHVCPGMYGEDVVTPAADALASLLSRQATADTPPPALLVGHTEAAPVPPPVRPRRRQLRARASTGPPIGPPGGPSCHSFNLSCRTHGASPWLAPPSGFVRSAVHCQA